MIVEPKIRPIRAKDMREVVRIAKHAFHYPWCREEFNLALGQPTVRGIVVEIDTDVAGFMIYEVIHKTIYILTMATAEDYARSGVATALIRHVQNLLSSRKSYRIEADVSEDALPMQLCLKKLGFVATEIGKNACESPDGELDSYRFLYTIPLDDQLPEDSEGESETISNKEET